MRTAEQFSTILAVMSVLLLAGCGGDSSADTPDGTTQAIPARDKQASSRDDEKSAQGSAQIVLAGGCFWCMEAAFEQLRGVTDVVSGYAGGTEETADYNIVSSGLTDHAEAIRVTYDPQVISQETLLRVFFLGAHDPTQINRQYPDIGRQYRSAVFYTDTAQQAAVQKLITELNASGQFGKPIATTLEPLSKFYFAEDYHQDYVKHNPNQPYVIAHSLPKAAKVRDEFPELIRSE